MNYYINENGQQYGPFTIEQLSKRGINAETSVWHEGMTQWTKAKNVPELIEFIQPTFHLQQPYAPYGVPLPPPDRSYPNDHKTLAIIATIVTFFGCYFIPIGLVSLIYSLNIESKWKRGDYIGAENYAKHAKIWGICTIILPIIFWGSLFISFIFNSHI